jgi:hypothetical protein
VPLPAGTPVDQDAYPLPYNGAISLKEVQDYLDAKKESFALQESWFMLSDVIGNIFQSSCADKKKAVKGVIDEFKSRIETKALVAMAQLEREETTVDKEWAALKAAMEKAKADHQDEAGRLQAVQPALNEFAQAIKADLTPEQAPSTGGIGPDTMKALLEEIVAPLRAEIAGLKVAQSQAPASQPVRKSLDPVAYPQLVQQSLNQAPKSKLDAQVARSVGLPVN